jgi:hypothetical protein
MLLSVVARSRPAGASAEEEVADAVFRQAFIPKRLDEVGGGGARQGGIGSGNWTTAALQLLQSV